MLQRRYGADRLRYAALNIGEGASLSTKYLNVGSSGNAGGVTGNI